jgi:hypothetical protein
MVSGGFKFRHQKPEKTVGCGGGGGACMQVILALRQLGPDCEFKASFSYTVRPWGGGARRQRERERERERKQKHE